MKSYFYDLHIHSCLSPCGDDASTPDSIVGMGELNGLDIMALTDHNTVKNCPAFFEAAKRHGILPIAGMELTTSEEIHMVCLFPTLENALLFGDAIQTKRILIPNRTDIFGNQLICDSEDNVISTDEHLLSTATTVSLDEAPSLVEKFDGICFPAHIDRNSNSVSAVLGVFPQYPKFSCAEVYDRAKLPEFLEFSGLSREKILINSDAHYLWDIKERLDFVNLKEIKEGSVEAGKYLIEYLKG
ncbi:MAG: PHP domain-containing protein [Ruminococcaceae bacterium]|nr:PHP domain-containing protein [Oscillospiraceae bacterium]